MLVKIPLVALILVLSAVSSVRAQGLVYTVEFLDRARLADTPLLPAGIQEYGPALISSNGRYVAGTLVDAVDFTRRVTYRWDRATDTLAFIAEIEGYTWVTGVNDQGDLAVSGFGVPGAVTGVVFWSDDTGVVPYGPLARSAASVAFSRALSDTGQMLIDDEDTGGYVVWDPRADTRVPIVSTDPLVLAFEPIGMNDVGQVVGTAWLPHLSPFIQQTRGFVWDQANGMRLLPGFAADSLERAWGINDAGVIVGEANVPGQGGFAARWPDADAAPVKLPCGEINGIPQFGCAAQFVNASGQTVGGGHYEDGEPLLAYAWDGTMPLPEPDLFDTPMTFCWFAALSDTGEIGALCSQTGDDGSRQTGPAIAVPVGQGDTSAPTVSDPHAAANPSPTGEPVALTAVIDDSEAGASNIVSASYTIDGSPPVPMHPADGAFDSSLEPVTVIINGLDEPGLYDLCVTGTDAAGNVSDEACTLLVVYDPGAGFVTGGGWIDSPAGAYPADGTTSGRATFGFVARYHPKGLAPDGNTEFQFQTGGLEFHTTAYHWLVIADDGTTAVFEGEGLVGGDVSPSGAPYRFQISVRDDEPDTFRIRIWYESLGAVTVVYDSGSTALGSGSIIVHARR